MRIVIVEDNGLFLDTLSEALQGRGVEVVGQAQDLGGALAAVDRTVPDVVLADIRLPPGYSDEGLQIASAVRQRYPAVGILLLAQDGTPAIAERLLSLEEQSRAVGYLMKERAGRLSYLIEAATRVAAGEVVIDPWLIDQLLSRKRGRDPLDRLTPQERRVLERVAEGRSNLGIAQALNLTVGAVERHLSSITDKLGLPSLTELERPQFNVRVLAVLAFLRHDAGPPGR
ncbi:response regulator [Phytohabitans houttuyneae]|uniref:DNA-binding response regulator n=1 Tax=Phytohabitans houttuyneae TaxID=1076126 RepID=A0A6V8K1F0_9ACTN|nr:response regulator transcription factor [Phytohabitans houttuyneae]GFJ77524.1 DNA-binding response regulator [Phytohabitans houttuyneae]